MSMHRQAALFSAAGYLCSAAEDLRSVGYEALAEEISYLVAYLDAELVPSVELEWIARPDQLDHGFPDER